MENYSSSTLPRKKAKTGVKKTGVKKTGKKSTGKKKPTSSTSAVHLAAPYNPYPTNTQYAPNYAPLPQTVVIEKPIGGNRRGKKSICALVFLAVASYLLAISLGLYVLTSCAWTMADSNKIYLAELSTNTTYDISLRVGYFGGCLSVTDAAAVSSSDGNSSAQTFTNCVSNMRRKDLDDLSEELWEHLDHEVSSAQSDVQTFLNTTLPQFKHLQDDVFFCEPPLVHALLFFISGIMLLVARTGTSRKKSYKAMLVIAITFSAFSLALALVTVLGTLQGMNALLDASSSGEQRDLGDSLYLSRGKRMLGYQGALTGIVGVFYISMGVLFVQRTPEGAAGTKLWLSHVW
ncbi:hypothetical protein DTO013E5_1809 [Penicillium roqueforti]|nr:hypothetical protein CBS147372_6873 [Penicillium roqueforti]KAI2758725.1 hypothetical protein DTO006G1_6122 [Penicillium roqueforti]KAI3091705.1 hypothetical protein CBS147338_8311 [Penicillium roqueforti]KAI3191610.1 hypothetical protein DTO032C6_1340 [Penicillium roqueforti]KAI3216095.1 hypothetical protein DTO013E5_1809 [Penicillium roqueforti]